MKGDKIKIYFIVTFAPFVDRFLLVLFAPAANRIPDAVEGRCYITLNVKYYAKVG